MKLVSVKLANSVKVGMHGGTEATFFQNQDYDLELKNSVLIQITSKRTKQTVCSSLFNCIYFVPEAEEVEIDTDTSKGTYPTLQRSGSKK